MLRDQNRRHDDHDGYDQQVLELRRDTPVMQEPGGHHRHAEFHRLGRLEADADVQPATRPLADIALGQDECEQDEPCEIAPRRPPPQEIRRQLRHHQHGDEGNAESHGLVDEQAIAFADRAVENEQAETANQ